MPFIPNSRRNDGYYSNYFDGTGDYFSIADNANLELSNSNFTIEFWFKTNSTTAFDTIIARNGNVAGSWVLYLNVSSSYGDLQFWSFDFNNFSAAMITTSAVTLNDNVWHHGALVRNGSSWAIYIDGVSRATQTSSITIADATQQMWIANDPQNTTREFTGYLSNVRIVIGTAVYTANFTVPKEPLTAITNTRLLTCQSLTLKDNGPNNITLTKNGDIISSTDIPPFSYYSQNPSPDWKTDAQTRGWGKLTTADNSSIDTTMNSWFYGMKGLIDKSVTAGQPFQNGVVSTYSLVYTAGAYAGGVLAPNGDIHFVPRTAPVGQKISSTGVVSTYSLVYTTSGAYAGGVLAPNGDIHFVPRTAPVGQKISAAGVVSTYSLVYTTSGAYYGGVLAPNGDIHFIPRSAVVGQKISAAGVVSTYSLVYTLSAAYEGGVLAPNGDIHFVPKSAVVGQKISSAGVVSTYSLVYTTTTAYTGGVLAPNGDIHFMPDSAAVGQKISAVGIVSTYSLSSSSYTGGALAPNGDIHFVPKDATVGRKISVNGVVSTYSLVYSAGSNAYEGGLLAPNGDIHLVPNGAPVGQKISTLPAIPFGKSLCMSPHFNKI